ncbi:PTS transporter subunit EIIB [Endozoicomonas ascidiicola]|uniref:PTS transporter subunit EIIB n=1 Tax=Endozoicomonas ascidiicola TaxID=1698521 RepID=UPI00082B62B0|nr:PTS glucose/sucrose transporter subunit IIB [Endozoicomonas ascidiicola]
MSSLGFFQRLKKALNLSGDDAVSSKPSAPVSEPPVSASTPATTASETRKAVEINASLFAKQCLKLVGGYGNATRIDACVTRIRLTLKDNTVVTDAQLKAIGAAAVVRVGDNNLQVVVGPMAQDIAEEMKKIPATEDLSKIEVPA